MIKEQSQTWKKASANIGVFFSRYSLSPNTYTWLTVPPAVLGFIAVVTGFIFTGVLLFILAGLLDLVDGAVARHRGQASGYGAFLDGSLDRIVDFFVIFSYIWLPLEVPGMSLGAWVALALYFAILPSFEVAYANHRQAIDDPTETLIWRILHRGEMYTLMMFIPTVAIFSPVWGGYLLIALVVLSIITTLQTFFATLYHSRKRMQEEDVS